MGKNLYRVIDTKTKKVAQDGFEKKQDAKAVRNSLNEETKEQKEIRGDGKPRYVVSRGPDHPYGETDGFDHKSRKKFY